MFSWKVHSGVWKVQEYSEHQSAWLKGQGYSEHHPAWLVPSAQEFWTFLEGCSSFWSLKQPQFFSQEGSFLFWGWGGSGSLPIGSRSEASTMLSPFRLIKGAMHFWSSHAMSQRTLASAPDLSAQHCSAPAKARVFSCLTVWKSLVPEASVWGRKSWVHSPQKLGGESHQPEASYCVRGSLKATACHWEKYKASGLLRLFPMVYLPRAYFLMAQISFHEWGCLPSLSFSVLIHWWGKPTGSGIPLIQGCDQGWAGAGGWMGWDGTGDHHCEVAVGDPQTREYRGWGLGALSSSLALPPPGRWSV